MKPRYALSFVASMIAIVCYLTLSLLAFSRYPAPFSPMSNWLSDLGSADLNPRGATFYNVGIIATGLALALFFLGLSRWKLDGSQIQRNMLLFTQGFGILGAVSMIMSGVYPITFADIHSFFSIALYVLLGTAFAFSVAALRYHSAYPRWLLALGGVVALVDVLSGVFHTVYALEWVTVALFLCYVGLVGIETNRVTLARKTQPAPTIIQW